MISQWALPILKRKLGGVEAGRLRGRDTERSPKRRGSQQLGTFQAGGVGYLGEGVVTDVHQESLIGRAHYSIPETPPCSSSPGRPRPPSAPTVTPTGLLPPSRRSTRTHLYGPGKPTSL